MSSGGGRTEKLGSSRFSSSKASSSSSSPSRYDLTAIEGFILVVHTSLGGDQLVFRYPPVTRTSISEETWVAVVGRGKPSEKPNIESSSSGSSMGGSSSSTTGTGAKSSGAKANEPPTSLAEPPVSISYADIYSPYDMPSVMLCNILSPKQSLCDRMFHTIIDQYRFFGFPTLMQKDHQDASHTEGKAEEAHPDQCQTSSSIARSGSHDLRTTHVQIGSLGSVNTMVNSSSSPSIGGVHGASSMSSSSSTLANPSQQPQQTQQHHKDELTMFNLVMVVPKEMPWSVSLMAQKMAVQIASALRHEQERCQYVSSEVFKMLRLRERWFTMHRRPAADTPPPNHTALTYEILQSSSLAQLIKNVYHSLRDDGSVQIQVNNWVNLSLNTSMVFLPESYASTAPSSLNSSDITPKALSSIGSPQGFGAMASSSLSPTGERFSLHSSPSKPSPSSLALRLVNDSIASTQSIGIRPIRPYHTLLLLDQQKTLDSLPTDCSPTLRRVVEKASPTKSFRELQYELGIPLAHLYRIAAHLLYWKQARVIDVLTRNNIYVLNPTPHGPDDESLQLLSFLKETFESTFQGVKLIDLLSRFSTPKKLSDVMQSSSSQSKFVDMVTWLIRQDLILQVHQFCFLTCPKLSAPGGSAVGSGSGGVGGSGGSGGGDSTANSGANPSLGSAPAQENDPTQLMLSLQQQYAQSSNRSQGGQQQQQPQDQQQSSSFQQQQQRNSFSSSSQSSPPHLLSPTPLTPNERLYLSQHDNGSKEFKTFCRLCPYFRGAHHMTEIAWRENITKEELLKVIGMYKHLLVIAHYPEDPIRSSV